MVPNSNEVLVAAKAFAPMPPDIGDIAILAWLRVGPAPKFPNNFIEFLGITPVRLTEFAPNPV